MKEKFNAQLENNKTVTEASLLEMMNKTYHNGDEVKVGDKILFGMILEGDLSNMNFEMIMLNENQLDSYELDDRYYVDTFLPVIKMK